MSGAHRRSQALAHEAPQRPAEGRRAASPDRHLGAPQGRGAVSLRGERRPSHKDNPPLGAKGQEEPSAGSAQRPHPASAREESTRPLCGEGTGGKLSSHGVKKRKERGGSSPQTSTPPSEVASDNPEKKRKHKHSGEIQSHKYEQRLHGLDAGKGPGGLLPTVREKVGDNPRTPEGNVRTPHLGRKPAGPPSEMEEAVAMAAAAAEAEEEEYDPPSMSFEAYLTYDGPPSEKASENPVKRQNHKDSGTSQSDKAKQSRHGSDAGKGAGVLPPKVRQKDGSNLKTPEGKGKTPHLGAGEGHGGLLPKVREKDGDTCKTPEGKVKTPHLGRKVAGPPPEVEQELDVPTMSSEAFHTHHQPPARKEKKSVKPPATALEGMSLRKEEMTSAQAEMGKSEKRPPPAAAGARLPLVPPPRSTAWPDLGLCPGQLSDPPLPAFASTSSFQPRQRGPPSPGKEEGARLMGIRLHSRTLVFSGSKRAGRRKMITMLQQCVQTLQNNVNLLSQQRGVPCSLLQHAVESDTPEEPPGLEEHHEAPAAETDPFWKQQQCHHALEKERRVEHTAQLRPQEQEVPELVLHLSANRPQDTPAKRAFSESSERGGAGAAVQEKAPPAPAPAADTRAPSDPASRHSCHAIPGKRVVSGQKPVKKMAPLMDKSIKDYKWTYFLR
ncbi:elongin-A-like [Myotis lucifugus]|uniref:elongin-A-like n=1 Tax=Myotis lucifugus TaxID=59463 RepID=UPI0006D71D07|nr:elongin-A-like [Myotis lucifugus]